MSTDLIDLIKLKYFDKGAVSATLESTPDKQHFRIRKYTSCNEVNSMFLKELEEDLKRPIEQKQLSFDIRAMKGFKRTTILSFIKKNKSLKDFENVYHSFYKNFGIDDLFNNLYITCDYSGKVAPNHPYSPYILFLLNQNFNENSSFSSQNFLNALSFNFKPTQENYSYLKESIYTFLDTHYEKAKKLYIENHADKKERTLSFDLMIYENVKKHISKQDLPLFSHFWKSILIKEKSETIFKTPDEQFFIFNLQYSYLVDNYDSITNKMYAKSACQFICNFIEKNYSNYLQLNIIKEDDLFTQFVCEFKTNELKQENLEHLIKSALQINENCKIIQNKYVKNQYEELYLELTSNLQKEIHCFILENTMPLNETFKTKIKKI